MTDYLLGLYEKSMPETLSLEEKLSAAKEASFDYMELSIDETDKKLSRLKWSDSEVEELRRLGYKIGLPIKSICLSGHRKYPLGHEDEEVQKRSLEIMQDAISLASKLGVRIIQIAGYDVYYDPSTEETRENFEKNLAISVEMAAREGVVLGFETMETEFINTVEKAVYWVNKINSPYLQVYPDIGNITNAAQTYGTCVTNDLESGKGHLAALHLKETVPGVFREVPYGSGHVDFPEAIKTALALGVRMFVGEFWYTGEEDWKATLRNNNAFLREAISRGRALLGAKR
ncbi:MAG: L-ribulose-5-phosphate 3-epimerase [Clostridiales bacterium]|nr:L-ribulose-5-phosphate 3-epimerase [Clostridiales bacterium]